MLSLSRLSRRPPILYRHYRRLCAEADGWSRDERLAHTAVAREAVLRRFDSVQRPTGVIAKAQLQSNPERFLRRTWWPVRKASTGGTTGVPLTLERSFDSIVFEQATIDHVVAGFGLELADARVAVFRGDNIKRPDDRAAPFWKDVDANTRVFSSIHLGPDSARAVLGAVQTFRPDILYCYPSTLAQLLDLARTTGVRLAPRLVLTSSEVPALGLHREVRASWDCPLLDYYGQAERVCFAASDGDGAYRFRSDYGQVRLDAEGRTGVVIGTGFHNKRQLLVDYDTGDALAGIDGFALTELADIALGLRPFAGVDGRVNESMLLDDGRQIVGFNQIPRGVPGVQSIQFVRTGERALDVVIVKASTFDGRTLEILQRNIALKIPSDIPINIVFKDNPLRTPRAKMPVYFDVAP